MEALKSRRRICSLPCFALALSFAVVNASHAQHVSAPHASVVDVVARQTTLQSTTDSRLREAIKKLHSLRWDFAGSSAGRAHRHSSSLFERLAWPRQSAEGAATKAYGQFEERIVAGMNQYLATGSQTEAACALDQLDAWAKAKALLDYDAKESTQAWFQVGWTLCSAGITDSVLVNDAALDAAEQRRVTMWLDSAAHKLVSFEKPGEPGNNLHYWRALAATAIGVTASDDSLFALASRRIKRLSARSMQRVRFHARWSAMNVRATTRRLRCSR